MSENAFNVSAEFARKINAWSPYVCQVSRNQDSNLGGTGFLIASGVLMTCSHVIPNPEEALKSHLVFLIESEEIRVRLDPDTLFITSASPGEQKICSNSNLDYTVVALQIKDLSPKVLAINQKTRSIFQDGMTGPTMKGLESVSMIHYPAQKGKNKNKQIGYGCMEITWRDSFNLFHSVLTKFGSSGAPLFNERAQLIGMHRGEQGGIIEERTKYGTAIPNEQFAHTNKDLEKKAIDLIFGKKSYKTLIMKKRNLLIGTNI